ncbi:MAG: hypothetical protein ACRYFS_17055 [Janthinobacterium lividum]
MFTLAELLEQLPELITQKSPAMNQVEYTQFDFVHPDSEESIVIHRGTKTDFESALQFWIHSIYSVQEQDLGLEHLLIYAQAGKFVSLPAAEFCLLVEQHAYYLRSPLDLPSKGAFISAMQMYDEWDDIALLAEFSEEYLSFYWSTTA